MTSSAIVPQLLSQLQGFFNLALHFERVVYAVVCRWQSRAIMPCTLRSYSSATTRHAGCRLVAWCARPICICFHSDVSWHSNPLSKRLIHRNSGHVMQINVCAERRTASGAVALQRMLCPGKANRAFLRIRVNTFESSYCAAPKLSPSSRRSAAAVAAPGARRQDAAAAASGAGASRDEQKPISVCFGLKVEVVCQWRRCNILLLLLFLLRLLTSVHRHLF